MAFVVSFLLHSYRCSGRGEGRCRFARSRRQGRRVTWDGGYIRYDSKGTRTFYIYRKIAGRLYEVSTRTHTESAAHAHLKQFEVDPATYSLLGSPDDVDPVYLTANIVQRVRRVELRAREGQR